MSNTINYNFAKLKNTFRDFYNVTGININLVTADCKILRFNKIPHNDYCRFVQSTEEGRCACAFSDMDILEKCRKSKKCEIHICHAGLVDVAVPLVYDDIILGYLLFGQMRTKNTSCVIKPCTEAAKKYYAALPLSDDDKIESVRNIATMLAKHILFEDMLKPQTSSIIIKAASYIDENLEKEITVDTIAKNNHISKSTLYYNFHKFLNCSVSEYINVKRVEKSIEFLKHDTCSVEEISRLVGYASPSYYVKNFKKIMGITPGKYRSKLQERVGMDVVYY